MWECVPNSMHSPSWDPSWAASQWPLGNSLQETATHPHMESHLGTTHVQFIEHESLVLLKCLTPWPTKPCLQDLMAAPWHLWSLVWKSASFLIWPCQSMANRPDTASDALTWDRNGIGQPANTAFMWNVFLTSTLCFEEQRAVQPLFPPFVIRRRLPGLRHTSR
jgi:hypothetical protein